MKTKLIKLSEDHYVIVDDSRKSLLSKGGSGYYLGHNHKIYSISDISNKPVIGQITHSFGKKIEGVENRPLSEVEEATNGYSIEKMAQSAFTHPDFGKYKVGSIAYYNGFKEGFKAHQEIAKDKLFTVEDLYAFAKFVDRAKPSYKKQQEFIQSLLPKEQSEWDVEFLDGKLII